MGKPKKSKTKTTELQLATRAGVAVLIGLLVAGVWLLQQRENTRPLPVLRTEEISDFENPHDETDEEYEEHVDEVSADE